MSIESKSQSERTFEGAGATIIFTDQNGQRNRCVFAMRNPDYVKNEKHEDSCEYPGGKVDEEDYEKSQSVDEAARRGAAREWDEEVFSKLPANDRAEANQIFLRFLNMSRYADVQGGKATIRLFALRINLESAMNDGGDRLLVLLQNADQVLEEAYQKDKSTPPLRGVVCVELKDLRDCIVQISNDISELEQTLNGGKLMKAIAPHCENNKMQFSHLHVRQQNQTITRAIRKFNFFTLRGLMKVLGLW